MRTRIAAAMIALALFLFPLGAFMIVSHSFDLSMSRERERALSEEAAIARAVSLEVSDASKDTLFPIASSLQQRYGSDALRVMLLYGGQPMANVPLTRTEKLNALIKTQSRATLLSKDEQCLYIAHRLSESLTLLLISDVSAVYALRTELSIWAGMLSLTGIGLSALLAALLSHWLAKPYKMLAQQRQALIDAMAHEMRTPLTAILGGIRLLERAQLGENQKDELLSVMAKETQRLTDMDNRLLLLTQMDHQALRVTAFSSMNMAQEALSVFEGVTLCGEDALFIAERELIIEMMRNLVVNAKRAGGSAPVCVRMECRGFTVTDHGCGMTKAQLERVFEPFYRAEPSRARLAGGAGLGLTLCAKIAKLHSGTLHMESEPGKGTTVAFIMREAG